MQKPAHILIVSWAIAALLPAASGVLAAGPRDPRPPLGSRSQQLALKQALEKHLSGTLVAELNYNKEAWGQMTPEQLRDLRERYYAFLRLDEDKKAELIRAMPEFDRLTEDQKRAYHERAAWLKKVVKSLTPAQREVLRKMTPAERAKRLLELKRKLAAAQPTSRPAAEAVTVPTR